MNILKHCFQSAWGTNHGLGMFLSYVYSIANRLVLCSEDFLYIIAGNLLKDLNENLKVQKNCLALTCSNMNFKVQFLLIILFLSVLPDGITIIYISFIAI